VAGLFRRTRPLPHHHGGELRAQAAAGHHLRRFARNAARPRLALRHANIYESQRYRHVVSSVLVERLEPELARASSNFQVVRIMHSGEATLFASGRYLDRIRIDGSGTRFEERIAVLDSRAVDTLLAIPI